MTNSVDPDQTAPIGAVCSGSTLLVSILNLRVKCIITEKQANQNNLTVMKQRKELIAHRKLLVSHGWPCQRQASGTNR